MALEDDVLSHGECLGRRRREHLRLRRIDEHLVAARSPPGVVRGAEERERQLAALSLGANGGEVLAGAEDVDGRGRLASLPLQAQVIDQQPVPLGPQRLAQKVCACELTATHAAADVDEVGAHAVDIARDGARQRLQRIR